MLNIFCYIVADLQFRKRKLYILLSRLLLYHSHRRNLQRVTILLLRWTGQNNYALFQILILALNNLQRILDNISLLTLGLHFKIADDLNLLHGFRLLNCWVFLAFCRILHFLFNGFGIYDSFTFLLNYLQQFLGAFANYKNISELGPDCIEGLLQLCNWLLLVLEVLPLLLEVDLLRLEKLLILLLGAILPQVETPLVLQVFIRLNSEMLHLPRRRKLRDPLGGIDTALRLKFIDDLEIQLRGRLLFSKQSTILELHPLSTVSASGQTAKQNAEIEVSMQDWFLFIKQQDLIKQTISCQLNTQIKSSSPGIEIRP